MPTASKVDRSTPASAPAPRTVAHKVVTRPDPRAPRHVLREEARPPRTSDLLRGILEQNPDTRVFTLETILRAIGEDRVEANLIFISLPTLSPLPGKPDLCEVSSALMAGQMAAGRPTLTLPPSLLEKEIPRRSLAIAIHAALPVIEAAEKFMRPRLGWLGHPFCRRVLGMFLFVLAAAVAFPLIGFDPLQSLSTFVISLGLAEGDGAAILLGVAVGVLSLAVIATSAFSARALRSKAAGWLRQVARKLGASALARFCERRGLAWIAKLLTFEWTELLLMWNPERANQAKAAAEVQPAPLPAPLPANVAQTRAGRATRRRAPEPPLPELIAA